MTDAIRPLIAGNWKMNGLKVSMAEFEAMLAGAGGLAAKADLLVCPPATLLMAFAEKTGGLLPPGQKVLSVGAQDCHPKASGAHTGDLSAEMLADAGATAIIVGHSERRGQLSGSLPDGATAANLVVAYEPVWAIGTGLTPTAGDVEQVHKFIRDTLTARFKEEGAKIRILYGGSVKPSNAAELMAVPNVNGALVGGASLKAADFLAIAAGCP